MERELIIQTVQSLRNELHRSMQGLYGTEAAWESLQAADYLLEKFQEANITDQVLVNSTLSLAIPYVSEVARFRGMMEIMGERHPLLKGKYTPVSDGAINRIALEEVGRDFWHMYNLLKEENGTDQSTRIPRSPSESSPSGHVQPGSE